MTDHHPQSKQDDDAEVLAGVRHIQEVQFKAANSVTIPLIIIIVAFISGLIGLGVWSRDLEQRKADRAELAEFKSDTRADLTEIKRDVKSLIYMHMKAKGGE